MAERPRDDLSNTDKLNLKELLKERKMFSYGLRRLQDKLILVLLISFLMALYAGCEKMRTFLTGVANALGMGG